MSGKGDSFERDMCRYLSLWLTSGKRDDVIWRNRLRKKHMSPDGRHQLGDIMAEGPEAYPFVNAFNVELKVGYSKTKRGKRTKNIPWDLLDLIDYNQKLKKDGGEVVLDFWKQTEGDAGMSNRIPLLIFKRDYHDPVVCVQSSLLYLIQSYVGILRETFIRCVFYDFGWEDLNFIRADDFFDWLTPEIVEVMCNKRKEERDEKQET